MYNEKEKQRYIEYKESQATLPENYLDRLFAGTQEVEYHLGLDVSEWTEPLIIEHYKKQKSPSLHSLIVMNGRLSEYVDYLYRNNGKVQKNYFSNITTDILRACVDREKSRKRFLNRNEFYLNLNLLDNVVDKFVLTALFEGIKGKGFENIWRLKLEHIHKEGVTLHNGKRLDLMDSKLYYFANESANTYYYYTRGTSDTATKMIGGPDQIIKATNARQRLEVNDDPVMIKRQDKNIFRKFERAAEEIGWEEVRPRTLLLSGAIEYTKRIADKYGIGLNEVVYNDDLFYIVQDRFIKITNKDEFMDATKYVVDNSSSSG